jgi:hypothetical protein
MMKVVVIVLLVHKINGGIGAEIGRRCVDVDIVIVVDIVRAENAVECSTGTASYERIEQKLGKRAFTGVSVIVAVAVVFVIVILRRG